MNFQDIYKKLHNQHGLSKKQSRKLIAKIARQAGRIAAQQQSTGGTET